MSANVSPIGVVSFPSLFVARAPQPGADPRYSVTLIFNADAQATPEFKALKAAAFAAAKEKWGDKAADMFKSGKLRSPIRDATEKEFSGYDEGSLFVNFWSKQAPGVVDQRLQDIIRAEDVYPGALGRVTYRAFAYDTQGNKGVSFGLQNFQLADASTPRLDGRRAAKDEFAPLDSGGTADLAMAVADDVPF